MSQTLRVERVLRESITFGVSVDRMEYDEASQQRTVSGIDSTGGRVSYTAHAVISAVALFKHAQVATDPRPGDVRGPGRSHRQCGRPISTSLTSGWPWWGRAQARCTSYPRSSRT